MKQPAPAARELIIESKTYGRFVVLYDADDEDKVAAHKWGIARTYRRNKTGHQNWYVRTNIVHPNGGMNNWGTQRKTIMEMHRYLLDTPKGMETDHINGNGLDNRKSNLRVCTRAENQRNRGANKNNISGFKGVRYMKKRKNQINEFSKPWEARIANNGVHIYLGMYKTPEEAAEVYDRKACELWNIVNPERMLNFPERYEEYVSKKP